MIWIDNTIMTVPDKICICGNMYGVGAFFCWWDGNCDFVATLGKIYVSVNFNEVSKIVVC